MDCAGKGNFDSIRNQTSILHDVRHMAVNHRGVWSFLQQGELLGLVTSWDVDAFFSRSNKDFLGRVLSQGGDFQNLLRGDVDFNGIRDGALSGKQACIYGIIFLLYVVCTRFREEGVDDAQNATGALRLFLSSYFGGPESQLDLLQSSNWPLSSWDIVAATLDGASQQDAPLYRSYDELVAAQPLPALSLLPPAILLPTLRQATIVKRSPLPCGRGSTARIGALGTHRQMQMHQLSALMAAWETVCGAATGLPQFEVVFTYTPAGPMSAYESGPVEAKGVNWEAEVQLWHGMYVHFVPKSHSVLADLGSLDAVRADIDARFHHGELRQADVVICGEPVYVCTAAAHVLQAGQHPRPLLAHLGIALLQQPAHQSPVLGTRETVARCMAHFLVFLAMPFASASVSNRITTEQIFWQVGVRLPLAHLAGLHLKPRPDRITKPEVLLFRTKSPYLVHFFLKLVKLRAKNIPLTDMNHYSSLSWDDIGAFQAAVLLPHNVHLIRTSDLYALEVPLFVPSAPFVFQFIYPGSHLYGWHGAPPLSRLSLDRRAQQALQNALGLEKRGYYLGRAPTAANVGETLPRERYRRCPYRMPVLGACHHADSFNGDVPIMEPCPWGSDSDRVVQLPLSCEEALAATDASSSSTSICKQLAADEQRAALKAAELAANGTATTTTTPRDLRVAEGPTLDPFDHFYGDYNPWCGIDAYRYWHAHTDYALLRGLQHFSGAADLVARLAALLLGPDASDRRESVLAEMREHQQARQRETILWWSEALLSTTAAAAAKSLSL